MKAPLVVCFTVFKLRPKQKRKPTRFTGSFIGRTRCRLKVT